MLYLSTGTQRNLELDGRPNNGPACCQRLKTSDCSSESQVIPLANRQFLAPIYDECVVSNNLRRSRIGRFLSY